MESVFDGGRQGAQIHALVLDPYARSREGLRASLEARGCVVDAAPDASHGLALMRASGFDLAVIDLGLLPEWGTSRSAWALARLFRVFNPSAPLLLLTAELRRDLEAEAARVSPALVLEKPIDSARLRAVVHQLRTELARG